MHYSDGSRENREMGICQAPIPGQLRYLGLRVGFERLESDFGSDLSA
jgi:hypothetical protein